MDPEGVLLNIETPGPSSFWELPEGTTLSIVRSSGRSIRDEGRLSDDGSPTRGNSRTAPHWPQRTAWAGFSPLQEGQIMIEC